MPRLLGCLLLTVTLLLTGCAGGGGCGDTGGGGSSASCAAGVALHGHFYLQWDDRVRPVRGARVAGATYPPCHDTGCTDGERARPTTVWRLRGFDPDQVLVGRSEGTGRLVVFGRPSAHPSDFVRRHVGVAR